MNSEENTPIGLYIENKKDIDKLRKDVENLLLADTKLYNKIDKIDDSLGKMEKGFSYSRETGHKTWEMVQKFSGDFGEFRQMFNSAIVRMDNQDERIREVKEIAKTANDNQQWLNRALSISIGASLIIASIIGGWSLWLKYTGHG